MPPTSTEKLIEAEHRRLNAERAEKVERKKELSKLPAEKDLPGKYSQDRSLFKCETREAAELVAKYFALRSKKPVEIWSDGSGWAVETHIPSPLSRKMFVAQKSSRAHFGWIPDSDLTDEEWGERDTQRENDHEGRTSYWSDN
jgi:hypothetical protein